jgi:hypothetical protein
MCRVKSSTTASLTALPAMLVPAPRGSTATSWDRHTATAASTSAALTEERPEALHAAARVQVEADPHVQAAVAEVSVVRAAQSMLGEQGVERP